MQFEESININASAEKIFAHYADVANWPKWDTEVISSSIEGAFASGAKGVIQPKGAPKSNVLFSEVVANKQFYVDCKLPLCKMRFTHHLSTNGGVTSAKHGVIFTGFLAPFFGRVIGNGIKKTLPVTLSGLKRAAEN
jgi:hypothetical protein